MMKVEILNSPGCAHCQRELPRLCELARQIDPNVDWLELDITQVIDYAVDLGVMKAPAVAIDGRLAFTYLPSRDELAGAMRAAAGNRDGH